MCTEIVPFVFRKKQFENKVEQEQDTNPQLDFHIYRLSIKRDALECINRNTDDQKKRKQQDDDMQNAVDPFLP